MYSVLVRRKHAVLYFGAVTVAFAIAMGSGCATFDGEAVREADASAFRQQLTEKTEAALAPGQALGLDDCLRIALENNLDIKVRDIQARIARLDKKVAFANFLPQVELGFQYATWEQQPKSQLGGAFSVAMQDKDMRIRTEGMQMPIFAPATWFAYSMRARGEEIGTIVAEYTRQMICLQTAAMYFQCAALDEMNKSLETQVRAAEALEKQVKDLREEGLVSESQLRQAELLALARRTALSRNGREIERARAELLAAMGLSPLAEISFRLEMPLTAPEGTLEGLVWQALLDNPRLALEDRKVAIQQDRVKLAITEFLPKVAGFATFERTSNSYMTFASSLMGGVAGVMSIFTGFANVNEYRIARQETEAAFVEREQACLTVMTEVVRGHLNLENALDDKVLANQALAAAEARLREVDAQWQEGLVNGPDKIAAVAERDAAQANVTNARFQEQVVIAALRSVLGTTYMGQEVKSDAE